jgi:UDP-glucose-4-epimerase GalE
MSKTIVVTGGCGYIGSHVARAFKKDNKENRVYIIDRVRREHTLQGIDGYFIDDFSSDASLATIVDLNPNLIVHCAGTSLVGPSMMNPAEYYDNNVAKTIKMLNVIKDMPRRPYVLFSSSASVYGEPKELPVVESSTIQPISPYGSTKSMVEHILKHYVAHNISSMCFRYFNAAGAEPFDNDLGQEPGATHIIARALEASIAGEPFTINGTDFPTKDGTCVRDYIHVWDLATAHLKGFEYLLEKVLDDPPANAFVFNLGTNKGISNREIAVYVRDKYGLSDIKYGQRRWGDPATLVADASRAQRELGWKPNYSDLPTIVDSAYKWYSRDA